jgi:hypothetical protein
LRASGSAGSSYRFTIYFSSRHFLPILLAGFDSNSIIADLNERIAMRADKTD